MARLVAIESGDYYDLSYCLLMVEDCVNLDDEHGTYLAWYEQEYLPAFRAGKKPEYLSFESWLIAKGKATKFECETWPKP
jgi:hypothetical protein